MPPRSTADDLPILTPGLGLFILAVAMVLLLARSAHYPLWHLLAELIAVAVSLSVFSLAWASRRQLENGYLVILGAAYVTVAGVDLLHALTLEGLNLLPGVTSDHPPLFWLTARFLEATAFVAAPWFARRRPSFPLAAWAFALAGTLGCLAVSALAAPPVEGLGLAQFKIGGEYLIILMLLLAQALLWRQRAEFSLQVFRLLCGSLLFAIASAFCFVDYPGIDEVANQLGHYFRILSVLLAYLALVVIGIRRPTAMLYRQLRQKDEELQDSKRRLGAGTVQDVTAQKQAELALRESEERYRAFYKKTPAIMHSIDTEGRLLAVSNLWLETLGYESDEVIGKKSADFLTVESRRYATQAVLPEFFSTGSCVDVPYRFVAKDGRVRDMLLSAFGERDADGRIARSLAVMVDVTARNRAEAALAESEQRFRGAFETAPHGMALVSVEGRFIRVNRALCTLLDYSAAELLATNFQTITPPEDLAADMAAMHDFLTGRIDIYQVEKRYVGKSGKVVWIQLGVSLIRTQDGTPVHFVAQLQDIHERKVNQQRLELLLAEQKTMLENDMIGIVRVINRTIVWANPAFEKMLGYAPRELAGAPTRQLFSKEEAYRAAGDAANAVLSTGNIFRSQIEYVRKDGQPIWVDISGSNLNRDGNESLWGFIDITERRQLEQSIAQNEERMELALAGADMGLWDLDLRTGRIAHNPRLLTMLGFAADELAVDAQGFLSSLHPEDAPKFSAAFIAHLKGETASFAAEYRVLNKSGNWVWTLSRGKVVERDNNGRAVRVTGTNLDISERKGNEAKLKARESRLAALIASMQDIVIVFDTGGTIVEFFRPPLSRHKSLRSCEEVIGKTYAEILPPAVANLVSDAIAGIMMDGQSRTFEYSLTIDGAEHLAQATMSPLLGASEYPIGFLKVVRDITAERTAQREFERLSRTNTLLLKSVGEGIYGIDLNNRVSFVNPAALDMLGFTEEELIGQEPHPLFHHHLPDGSPYPVIKCPLGLTMEDGKDRHDDNEWYWRKDGSGFPVAMTVTPVVEQERQVGVVVVFQDISERKAQEARIHDLAFYDPLTRLPNRRLLLDRLGLALPTSGRRNTHGAVLFLDLDNFKILNDTQGHEFGDLLLMEAARRLLTCVRAEDTVARLGGDEFVVMLEDLSAEVQHAAEQARLIAEKIRGALGTPYLLKGYTHQCTTSIGICLFKGTQVKVGELLKRADMAMYQAKAAGRNTLRVFQSA